MTDSDGAKLRLIRWQHGNENEPPIQQITFYGGEAIADRNFSLTGGIAQPLPFLFERRKNV